MSIETMKIEVESEKCCVCGAGGEELWTPEEHDAGAPAHLPPLRAVLLHLNHAKTVASGRLCARCIQKAQEAYAFSCSLAARGPPPLADKIRALRSRLAELTAKIDVFIVVGGGANGAYSEEDIIMVEKAGVEAAAAGDARPPPGASLAGEPCYQCTVCPQTFQVWSEYSSHVEGHGAGALHSCWSCGAQFQTRAAASQHAASHGAVHAHRHLLCGYDGCILRFTTRASLVSHLRKCHGAPPARAPSPPAAPAPVPCPSCPRQFASLAAMRRHSRVHRRTTQDREAAGGEESRVEYLEVEALDDMAEEALH